MGKVSALRSSLPPINSSFKAGDFLEGFFFLAVLQFIAYGITNWAQRYVKHVKKPMGKDDVEILDDGTLPEAPLKRSPPTQAALAKDELDRRTWAFASWACWGLDYHARWLVPVLGFFLYLFTIRPW